MSTIAEAFAAAFEHYRSGRLAEGERICREILSVDPNCADAWNLLGGIARAAGRLDVAFECMERFLTLAPESPDAHTNLGAILEERGKLDRAIMLHKRAIQLAPGFTPAHFNLGNALKAAGNLDEAINSYRRAIEHAPTYWKVYNNLGIALRQSGQLDEAIACYLKALELKPDYADAQSNVGNALLLLGRRDEAQASYRRALVLDPNCADAHAGLSQVLLVQGDFERGWPEYEWRWKTGQLPVRDHGKPPWNGEALEGKTVLVRAEQGLGDTIQFVRYLKLLNERGARVVFNCPRALVPLLRVKARSGDARRTLPIDLLIAEGEALPEFDFHVPLLSLPGISQTRLETIPAEVPYLFADQALVREWETKLDAMPCFALQGPSEGEGARATPIFRIGINWHGRAGMRESLQRDVPVEMFEHLARVPGVRLISLQKEESAAGVAGTARPTVAQPAIVDLGEIDTEHGAFMDTAAIMMNLDLVITSDTSIAHLAGALAVPVWVALPFVPDWRWLLDRSDSPWYPTMRLFRQKKLGDWAGVFEEIEAALRE